MRRLRLKQNFRVESKFFASVWPCGAALLLFALAACTAPTAAPAPTPRPAPTVLGVHLPTDLLYLTEAVAACGQGIPDVGLLFSEAHVPPFPQGGGELTLWIGDPPEGSGFAAGLGLERIILIVNAQNPIASLPPAEARALLSGEQSTWADGTPVEVWVPLEGSIAHWVFGSVFGSLPVSPEAFLSPSPAAAVQAVQENAGALAIIPAGWAAGVKPLIPLADVPVVALTDGEPQGKLRALVGCLQGAQLFSEP
jgi:hypothetical protein